MKRNKIIKLVAVFSLSLTTQTQAQDVGQKQFEARLAASRARAGDVFVNGVVNIAVDPANLRGNATGRRDRAADGPLFRLAPDKPVHTINVVMMSPVPVVVWRPQLDRRTVEILPILSERSLKQMDAFLPFGAVILPDAMRHRDIRISHFVELESLRVRSR